MVKGRRDALRTRLAVRGAMEVRAREIRVGDHIFGRRVVWVLPTPDRRFVLVGTEEPSTRHHGQRRDTRRFNASDKVQVDRRGF
jgi:hypothetical protein